MRQVLLYQDEDGNWIAAHQEAPIEGEYDLREQIFDALRLFKT